MLGRPSLRAGLPFGVVAWVVLASEFVATTDRSWEWTVAAALCLIAVSIGFVVATRRPQRTWLDPAVAALFCGFVLLAREAGGGVSSGVSSLYLVPILWLALTGTRLEMLAITGLTALCLVAPIVVVGGDAYPPSDWRRSFVTVALGLTIGWAAQWMVEKLRAESRRRQRSNRRVSRLFDDAPHGVGLLDPHGAVLRANASLANILGLEVAALESTRLPQFESPGTLVSDLLGSLGAHQDAAASREGTLMRGDGTAVHVVISARRMDDEISEGLVMVNVVDISERHGYEERLAFLVDHDTVTGLLSRHRFDAELREHQAECERNGPQGALLLLDLDHFKQVNDSLGHAAGDYLLQSISGLITAGIATSDVAGRVGGDEFAILLREADQYVAEQTAQAIVLRVARHTGRLSGPARRVGASIGVVTFAAAQLREEDIFALADMTMYDAKEAGRGRVAVLAEGDHSAPALATRMLWQNRIEAALETDSFVLKLQPIRDLATGEVRAAEALLRLPVDGQLVTPGRFLPTAEAVGLMPRIDAWVVTQCVHLLSRLRARDPDFVLEVNLSGLSMGQIEVEAAITQALVAHPELTGGLVLEVTETAAVADLDAARGFSERMTVLGCSFALDDFGVGFGSLSYLRQLHFDYIKIDGEFVEQIATSPVDRAILRSVVALAKTLGKRTVAEYVTTPEVLAAVHEEGVDYAQGYAIGAPMDVEEFVMRFLSHRAGGDR